MTDDKMIIGIKNGKIMRKESCGHCSFGCIECNQGYNYYNVTDREIVRSNNELFAENMKLKNDILAIQGSIKQFKDWADRVLKT